MPTYLALRADRPFTAVSSGFVGTASDGLSQLDSTHALAPLYTDATNGNVEQTAQLDVGHGREFTLALGFGTTQSECGADGERHRRALVSGFPDLVRRAVG